MARVDDVQVDLDDRTCVALDDEATFRLIRSTHTLGCFQIESPGQRELVGKFGPETFDDLIIDISLFRPGPVKSDMVTPFLLARQGWRPPEYLHPSLEPALKETHGVVVFHEQVLQIVSVTTGVTLAEADEVRRALGSPAGQREVEAWWRPLARARGYSLDDVDRIWEVLKAFASFGFCKAHAAAFALPTYQSAWLKAHHPAAFLSGVLTHDPGMYPKRLILDDARNLGIAILGLDVNASGESYRVEKVASWDEPPPAILDQVEAGPLFPDAGPRQAPPPDLPDGRAYGIRLSLADVKGISDAEVQRIVAGQPYLTLADFWHRAQVSRPVVERLVVAGGFDTLYGLGGLAARLPLRRRGKVTRRDLLLQVVELDSWSRATARSASRVGARPAATKSKHVPPDLSAPARSIPRRRADNWADNAGAHPPWEETRDVRLMAAAQSQAPRAAVPAAEQSVQLALDLGDAPDETRPTGLPEMSGAERVKAELEVLGLDASAHVLEFYDPLLRALGITRAQDLLAQRSRAELFVAGVKVATQTPPIRSGRRVVFLTLDDATGPVDATFFEDVQGPYAATVFHSLAVAGARRAAAHRTARRLAAGDGRLGAVRVVGGLVRRRPGCGARQPRRGRGAGRRDAWAAWRPGPRGLLRLGDRRRGGQPFLPPGDGRRATGAGRGRTGCGRHGRWPAPPAGPGARERLQAVAVRRCEAPRGGRAGWPQARPEGPGQGPEHDREPGHAARPQGTAQALARQPRQLRPLRPAPETST